jgi:hypothetical protein
MVTRTIPTGEPTTLVRGDSAKWIVIDAEYPPADGWTMTYYLVSKTVTRVTWNGSADNGDGTWLVTLSKADTRELLAGIWNWQRVATKGSEQVTRGAGTLTVSAGFASAGGTASPFVDGRSFERQALDELEAVLIERLRVGQVSMSYNGRSVSWSSAAEMYQLRAELKTAVDAQELAQNAGLGRQIRIRYGN